MEQVTFKTRLNKDDKSPVETKATLDFEGVSIEQLRKLAVRSVIIDQQAIYRTSGVIPATDTIKVSELINKSRQPFVATPESIAARAMKMSDEDKQKLLETLMAQIGK